MKLEHSIVLDAMKKHRWICTELVSKCAALGVVRYEGQKAVVAEASGIAVPRSFVQAAADRRVEMRKQDRAAVNAATAGGQGQLSITDGVVGVAPQTADAVPSKYTCLNRLSVTLMGAAVLTPCEPMVFSKSNLRNATPHGRGEDNQILLTQICEFMTGLPPDFSLTGEYAHFSKLTPLVTALNLRRGRRCQRLEFPVDWARDGNYAINEVNVGAKKVVIFKKWES